MEWTDLDAKAVDVIRALTMDAVEEVGNGHPGTAMSLAPAAYLLYQRLLRHDPSDPEWLGRDRFVLSCGHSSLTLYIQLYLSGYGLTLDDIKAYRKWQSLTPGHPEYGHTVGVETTTGPLGQGISTAVGMAMGARRNRAMLDAEAAPGESVFDHTVWVFASDGDMQEGVASEASSLAGHQRLGNLVVLYDDNHVSIDGDTAVAFSEDVVERYEAYGWHTQRVEDVNDVQALHDALVAARDTTDRPSLVSVRSIIGWPAPNKQDTGGAHGAALGADEVAATKEILGFDPAKKFDVPDEVLTHARKVLERGRELRQDWEKQYQAWRAADAARATELDRLLARRLPDGWTDHLPEFPAGKPMATRKASGEVINAVAPVLPELWGGSADLTGSNNTEIKGEPSFLPASSHPAEPPTDRSAGTPGGRNVHFGVREHAMGAALSGIVLAGLTRPYGGTFLTFSDYMRGSVRLASLMGVPTIYVWTHDSIGLGEDGPTHQPVEHYAALRAIPGLDVVRPADANETVVAWRAILEQTERPAGLLLTRQNVAVFDRSPDGGLASAEGVARGAYVLAEADGGQPQVLLVATGSEVEIALAARDRLQEEGTPTRVVSMPCREWFDAQDQAYRDTVLPPSVKARVSVEAGVAQGWREVVGDAGVCVSLEHYGASADYKILYEQYGLTPDRVVAAAHSSLARA